MKIQRFTGTISFLPGKIFVHNMGIQAINTTTDRAILKDNELIISINPVNNQASGVLKLLTSDAIRFTGFFHLCRKRTARGKYSIRILRQRIIRYSSG
jgi:hypothetical protein